MTSPEIHSFSDLVTMALGEPDPPQLLTVLIRAESVQAGDENGTTEGQGVLKPIMVKSHSLTPELEFERLGREADELDDRWAMMMVAILPGRDGKPPAPVDVDENLKMMARTLLTGGDLSRFLFFDREGTPVEIGRPVDLVRSGSTVP